MRLTVAMLDPFSSLNSLIYRNQINVQPGESPDIYFQLIDQDSQNQVNQIGNRYMPASGATMQVAITSINNANTLTKTAVMAFPSDDRSIWKISLSAADTASAAGNMMKITLTEGASVKIANVKGVLSVQPANPYQC